MTMPPTLTPNQGPSSLDRPEEMNQLPGETDNAYMAFLIWVEMGRGRSYSRAYHQYRIKRGLIPEGSVFDASVRPSNYFSDWAKEFHWKKRKEAYDSWQDRITTYRAVERKSLVEDNAWSDYHTIRLHVARLLEQITESEQIVPRDLLEAARVIKEADDLGRRTVGLPDRITHADLRASVESTTTVAFSAEDLHALDAEALAELGEWNNATNTAIIDATNASSGFLESGEDSEGVV